MKISVVVTTFNHKKYIAQSLESILSQKGDFEIELIIGDDCSTDNTRAIAQHFQERYPNIITLLPPGPNLGITKNLKRCLDACSGDYIAICEGDDYWTDTYKLQKQMAFLESHPDFSMCFSAIMIFFEGKNRFEPHHDQLLIEKNVLTTEDLIEQNHIGNFSCCMYRTSVVRQLPAGIFDIFTVDWMFNIACSRIGAIGFIRDWMSVYRKHPQGAWAGREELGKLRELRQLIDTYNAFFNYEHNDAFTKYAKVVDNEIIRYQSYARKQASESHDQREIRLQDRAKDLLRPSVRKAKALGYMLRSWLGKSSMTKEKVESAGHNSQLLDIAIVDDIFPHPLSAFRMQEFMSYLKEFQNLEIYSSGAAISLLGERTFHELVADFRVKHPQYAGRIKKLEPDTVYNAKLAYAVFLINIYLNIEQIEKLEIPFIFTLYPGGGFGLNVASSDEMLKRVFSSPCFRKVIVTQKVTYDYLINHNYCKPEQIKFIFGVVTPLDNINMEYTDKKYYGIDKQTLDICFVAYKYTNKGIDKGYDVFMDVANRLSRNYDNIRFHVVGGFDEHEIDVTGLEGKITFYGKRDTEWFDHFYKDKDIILSPNIPGLMYPGSFDGFPTGSCVDAGLRKTAIFCTDELNLNKKAFSDGNEFMEGKEIVIIPHNAEQITSTIERYFHDPQKLKAISENGSLRLKQLFGFEAQILPRINVLKTEIELAGTKKRVSTKPTNSVAHIYKASVSSLKLIINSVIKMMQGHPVPTLSGKTGKIVKFLFWIRHLLAPPGSRRARLFRRLYDHSFGPLLNVIRRRRAKGHPVPLQQQVVHVAEPQYRCPLCQNHIHGFRALDAHYEENWSKYGFPFNFDDFETLNSKQYYCPNCGATDRDRLYALYLPYLLHKDSSERPLSILDIAPSSQLRDLLLKYPNISYQSADKYMEDVDFQIDITNMHLIPKETYDFLICSHVLEHVPDDKKALSELFRILRKGGSGILMVPLNLRIDKIEEAPNAENIEERWRRFGQNDHIRLYSKKGFIERVEASGFTINQYDVDFFGKDTFIQHGISLKSILYIVNKN